MKLSKMGLCQERRKREFGLTAEIGPSHVFDSTVQYLAINRALSSRRLCPCFATGEAQRAPPSPVSH